MREGSFAATAPVDRGRERCAPRARRWERRPPRRRSRPRSAAAGCFPPSRGPQPLAPRRARRPGTRTSPGRRSTRTPATTWPGSRAWGATRWCIPTSGATAATESPTPPSAGTSAGGGWRVTAYPGESDFGRAPIPPGAPVEGGSDRHVLILQRQRCDLFELFDAHYVGGPGHRWRAASTARFDLRSRGLREDGWTSADAAGLPILPGLVRHGEVRPGPRPPRDPGHLRRDPPRLHPSRHPLRLEPMPSRTCRRWGFACG